MLDQEAADAGELVGLRGQDDDIEVEVGEVLAGEFKPRVVRIIGVDDTRHFVGNALLQSLDRVGVLIRLAGGVVVRSHASPLLVITHQPRSAAIVCRNPGSNANAVARESPDGVIPPNFRHALAIPASSTMAVGCWLY